MRYIAGLLLLACGYASAQDLPPTIVQGEQVTFSWVQDPLCTTDAPITECPITGYFVQIEREQNIGAWSNTSSVPMGAAARSYTWTANGSGTTCFRVQVLNSAAYEQSPPSNIKCVRVIVPLRPGAKPPILTSSKDPQ